MATRIVFDKDFTVEVEEDVERVRRELQTGDWPEFKAPARGPVTVNAAQVAYVQEAASRKMHAF